MKMKKLTQVIFIAVQSFFILGVVFCLFNMRFPFADRFITQKNSWLVQISGLSYPVQELESILTSPLEQTMRSVVDAKDTTFVTYTDKVTFYFYTESDVNTEVFKTDLVEKLAQLKVLPGLEEIQIHLYHKPMSVPYFGENTERHDNFSTSFTSEHERLALFGKNGILKNGEHIFVSAPEQIKIHLSSSQLDGHALSALVKKYLINDLATSLDAQGVYARNLQVESTDIVYNSSLLLKQGDTPGALHQRVTQALSFHLSERQRVLGHQVEVSQNFVSNKEDLGNVRFRSVDGTEKKISELASLKSSKLTLPVYVSSSDLPYFSRFATEKTAENAVSIAILLKNGSQVVDSTEKVETVLNASLASVPVDFKVESLDPRRHQRNLSAVFLLFGSILLWILKRNPSAVSYFSQVLLVPFGFYFLLLQIFEVPWSLGNAGVLFVATILSAVLSQIQKRFFNAQIGKNKFKFGFLILSTMCLMLTLLFPFGSRLDLSIETTVSGAIVLCCVAVAWLWAIIIDFEPPTHHFCLEKGLLFRGLGLFVLVSVVAQANLHNTSRSDLLSIRMKDEKSEDLTQVVSQNRVLENFTADDADVDYMRSQIRSRTLMSLTDRGNMSLNLEELKNIVAGFLPESLGWIQSLNKTEKLSDDMLVRAYDENFIDEKVLNPEHMKNWLSSTIRLKELVLPLDAAIEATMKPTVFYRVRDDSGILALAHVALRNGQSSESWESLSNKESKEPSLAQFRWLSEDRNDQVSRFYKMSFLFALSTFFISALYFNSVIHGVMGAATFLMSFLFISSLSLAILGQEYGPRHMFLSYLFSLVIFCFWAVVMEISDAYRKSNFSFAESIKDFRDAIQPLLYKRVTVIVTIVALFLACFPSSLQSAVLLMSTYVFVTLIQEQWMNMWSTGFEQIHRFHLRTLVKLSKSLLVLLLAFVALFSVTSRSASASEAESLNASCSKVATVVLPLVGMPKGKEPSPLKILYTERLAQKTPCAWIHFESEAEVVKILQRPDVNKNQEEIVKSLVTYAKERWQDLAQLSQQKFSSAFSSSKPELRVFTGFFEEFYGNVAFTVIDVQQDGTFTIVKRMVAEVNETEGIAVIAEFFRDDRQELFDNLLRTHERIPVAVEASSSVVGDVAAESLAGEVELFLKSRLEFPIQKQFFERKPFFRLAKDGESPAYKMSLRLRRDGIKFYASIEFASLTDSRRKTAWVEGDLTQLPEFEEQLMRTSLENITDLEGIYDYSLTAGPEFLFSQSDALRFVNFTFRQNRGNAAFSARFRSGTKVFSEEIAEQRVLMVGGAVGWQFFDVRWLSADAGLGLDLGVSSKSFSSIADERSILVSYGPYLQAQSILTRNFTVFGRAGLEKPAHIQVKQETYQLPFEPLYLNIVIGGGFAF